MVKKKAAKKSKKAAVKKSAKKKVQKSGKSKSPKKPVATGTKKKAAKKVTKKAAVKKAVKKKVTKKVAQKKVVKKKETKKKAAKKVAKKKVVKKVVKKKETTKKAAKKVAKKKVVKKVVIKKETTKKVAKKVPKAKPPVKKKVPKEKKEPFRELNFGELKKLFFHEVPEGEERVIKRGDKNSAVANIGSDKKARGKGLSKEETPEELVERIARELDEQHIFKRGILGPPKCTKCGTADAVEEFTIDKELAYCAECAELLHLGETKEARKLDYPSLFKKDGNK